MTAGAGSRRESRRIQSPAFQELRIRGEQLAAETADRRLARHRIKYTRRTMSSPATADGTPKLCCKPEQALRELAAAAEATQARSTELRRQIAAAEETLAACRRPNARPRIPWRTEGALEHIGQSEQRLLQEAQQHRHRMKPPKAVATTNPGARPSRSGHASAPASTTSGSKSARCGALRRPHRRTRSSPYARTS